MRKIQILFLLLSFYVFWPPAALFSGSDPTGVDSSLSRLDSATLAAIRFNPRDVQFHIKRGIHYLERNFPDSATTVFELALTLCDTIPEIYNYMGIIELAKAEHPLIPMEKLLRLFKQDRHSQAIKYFKHAIALAPGFIDAHYHLGKTYLFRGGEQDLIEAEKEFKYILERLFRYEDTVFLLGRTFQQRQEFDRAIRIFKGLAESRHADGRESIHLAAIYYEIHQYELACASYFRGLEILTDSGTFETLFESTQLLFDAAEKAEFSQLSNHGKGRFMKKIWLGRDPSPGTVLNERLIEHFRRVEFARNNFHYTAPPYYDDRGKIYIKFGAPGERFSLPVGQTIAKANESWCYGDIHPDLVFDFVEDGGIYRLVEDLREAALPGTDPSARLLIVGELYNQRSHISNVYARLSVGLDQSKMAQFHSDRIRAKSETPPDVFVPDKEAKPLPIVYKLSQFRGHPDSTEALFYFSVPAAAFNFTSATETEKFQSNLDYTLVLLDSLYDPQYQFNLSKPLYLPSLENVKFGNFVFQNHHQFSPGQYEMQILVKTDAPKRAGLYQEAYKIKNFQTDTLAISDLLLAASIEAAESGEKLFVRNQLKLIPHPFYSVLYHKPIYLYFEIYNLGYNDHGEVNYEIEYTAKTIAAKQTVVEKAWNFFGGIFGGQSNPAISTAHRRTEKSRDVFEYLAFDFQNMKVGRTRLAVTVTDLQLGQTVSDSVEFNLIE
jgi:GWxTD domain-containing protein